MQNTRCPILDFQFNNIEERQTREAYIYVNSASVFYV